jgi:uncharacterized protein YciI
MPENAFNRKRERAMSSLSVSSLLLFRCDTADIPAAFAKADPYVLNGLVARWQVNPWNTVVGDGTAMSVRPE